MTEIVISTSLITAALLSLMLWLSRTWITARLKADIKLDNDTKLEDVKSELRRTNEKMSDVSSAGGQALSQVQAALLPHKIKAIDSLWSSVLKWDEMIAASIHVSVLSIDWVREHGSDPSTKENFELLLNAPAHLEFLKARKDAPKPACRDRQIPPNKKPAVAGLCKASLP